MNTKKEVLELMFDLTFNVTDYIRCNRHGKHGPRIRDILLFKTIYCGKNHQIKMSELASILNVSPAAVSQLVAGFEKQGLLQRVHSNEDRRSVYIQIVPDALQGFQEKYELHLSQVNRYLDNLGEADCEHLRDILMKTKCFMEENE